MRSSVADKVFESEVKGKLKKSPSKNSIGGISAKSLLESEFFSKVSLEPSLIVATNTELLFFAKKTNLRMAFVFLLFVTFNF